MKSAILKKDEITSFLIVDYHQEYPIPEMLRVSVRKVWDGGDAQDIIKIIKEKHPELISTKEELLVEAFIGNLGIPNKVNDYFEDLDEVKDDASSIVHSITIWEPSKELIEDYLDLYEVRAWGAIIGAGGDDDFFDYMPNFVDTFRQVCEYLGDKERYNKMIKKARSIETDPQFEFYVEEIK